MKLLVNLILIFFCSLLVSSCIKDKKYPNIPEINVFDAYIDAKDSSVYVTFQFNDGDGDIGLEADDTLPPFNFEGEFYNNLRVEYLELQNGVWTKTTNLDARLPDIQPKGKNKVLEGQIRLNTFYNNQSVYDTIRYRLTLIDRALNLSNASESPILIKP